MAAKELFKPKEYTIRTATNTGRRNGATINPPRLPEIGGMSTRNADKREGELTIKKPGGTR